MIHGWLFLSLEIVNNRLTVRLLTFEWYLHEIYVHCRISLSEINFTTIKAVLHDVNYRRGPWKVIWWNFGVCQLADACLLRKKIGEFRMLMSTTNSVAFTTRKSLKSISHFTSVCLPRSACLCSSEIRVDDSTAAAGNTGPERRSS